MTIDRVLRKSRVLEAIVRTHIASAEPVGSKHIGRILGLSSATIRSVMFELEGEGLLGQPYTSAGRVPTDLGYRKYVDNMTGFSDMGEQNLSEDMRKYLTGRRLFEEIIQGTTEAISKITKYTAIALSPNNRLYFDGTYHMLEQPEFMELNTAREFLRILEEREELLELMSKDLERSTSIHIGRENAFEKLSSCTIITSTYRVNDGMYGSIGVIGPMRMKYEEVVPMVEALAGMTRDFLEEMFYERG